MNKNHSKIPQLNNLSMQLKEISEAIKSDRYDADHENVEIITTGRRCQMFSSQQQ